jgi:hypothetical protein
MRGKQKSKNIFINAQTDQPRFLLKFHREEFFIPFIHLVNFIPEVHSIISIHLANLL